MGKCQNTVCGEYWELIRPFSDMGEKRLRRILNPDFAIAYSKHSVPLVGLLFRPGSHGA